MSDAWAEATYDGKKRGERRRATALTAEQLLAWVEEQLRALERSGELAVLRARKQAETMKAWNQADA